MPVKYIGETVVDLRTVATPVTPSTSDGSINATIWFDGTNLKCSLLGGAAQTILVGSISAASMQSSYNAGRTIVVAGAAPVSIANAAGVVSNLLALTENCIVTNADVGLSWSRSIAPSPAGQIFTGSAVKVVNAPIGTNNCTESGVLVSVAHSPTAGAGVISDGLTVGLGVTITPVAASTATGISVAMGTLSTGPGVTIAHGGTAAGAASVALRLTGAPQSVGIQFDDGISLDVAPLGKGRLRYNDTTKTFQVSVDPSAAFVSLATGAATTLQGAYTGSPAIIVTAGNPITITDAAGVASNLINLTEAANAVNADFGIFWDRAATPTGNFTGGAIKITNRPVTTNAVAENPVLISVLYASTGAAATTETATGLAITMTPVAAAVVVGAKITMSPTSTGQGVIITHSGSTAPVDGGTQVALRLTGDPKSVVAEFDDGVNASKSAAGEGRLIYDDTAKAFRVSIDGGVYTSLDTVSAGSLQVAYNAGAAIVEAGGVPVAISSTTADNASLLTLVKNPAGAQTGSVFTVNATPGAAAAMNGMTITMGANCNTSSSAILIDWRSVSAAFSATGMINLAYGAPTTVTSALGLLLDFNTNVTTTASLTGAKISMPVGTAGNGVAGLIVNRSGGTAVAATSNWNGNLISIQNTPDATPGAAIESGTVLFVSHVPIAGIITDTVKGIRVVMTPLAASAVSGIVITMGAFSSALSVPFKIVYSGTAGNTNGISWITSAATVNAAPMTGSVIDLSGVTATSGTITGISVLLPVQNGVNTSAGLSISRTGALAGASVYGGSLISLSNTPAMFAGATEQATILSVQHITSLNAGIDATIGIAVTMTPATLLSSLIQGVSITMGANAGGAGLVVIHGGTTPSSTSVAVRIAGNTNSAGLELVTGASLAVSNASEARLRFNATQNALQVSANAGAYASVAGVIGTTNATSTFTGVASTTLFGAVTGTTTLPAGALLPGKILRISCRGIYSTGAINFGNVVLKLKFGATTVLTADTVSLTASQNNQAYLIDIYVMCVTAGIAGASAISITGTAKLTLNTLTTTEYRLRSVTNVTTVDTTVTEQVDVQWAFDDAAATNVVVTQGCSIELLN